MPLTSAGTNELVLNEVDFEDVRLTLLRSEQVILDWVLAKPEDDQRYLSISIGPGHFQTFVFDTTHEVLQALHAITRCLDAASDLHLFWVDGSWLSETD